MKKIEVTTAQKVIIQYELATLRDRIIAFTIDFSILMTLIITVLLLITFIVDIEDLMSLLIILTTIPIFIFYTLIAEVATNGRTPGKIAMALKVIKVNGGLPTLEDFVLRWAFRSVDIYFSLGAVACLLISSSDKSQRLGELLSNTAVVKLKTDFNIKIEDLESMFEVSDNYKATYPEVIIFRDEDMLAIKELIKRYLAKPNEVHIALLEEVSLKISKKLQLTEDPKDRLAFLQSVLNDYVMLTR